ncbi:MAG: CoA transferase [Candidatus Rokubacteria bacterium]|nr:CoA transferase [Candidatus Rokubacteria bacterium]
MNRAPTHAQGAGVPASEESWYDWIRAEEDPARVSEKPEALDDLLVLDLSHGHYGALLTGTYLAELGAEVVKVEPPGGEPARRWGPSDTPVDGEGLAFVTEARNRYFVTLNLETEGGRALLGGLAGRADVLIEGFAPGYLDSLGVGYRQLSELNPRLVYIACSSYGQFGPEAEGQPAEYDLIDQARSGLLYVTGDPEETPMRVGSWISAYAQAAWACVATLAALHWRCASGRGQLIDVSGAEALMRYLEYTVLLYHATGQVRERTGLYELAVFPYTFVRVKDGYAFIAGYTDPNFQAICRIMGRPELARDPRFSTTLQRTKLENEVALRQEIERWSTNFTAEEILQKVLADPGPGIVVSGPMNSPLATLREAHWWERGCFARVQDPIYGELLIQMPAWRMTRTPPRVKWSCRPVGYHNGHVYQKYFGLGPGRLAELRDQGVL